MHLFIMFLSLVVLSGCAGLSHINYDKSAMAQIKSVAVLVYSVPPTIEYRDDPKQSSEDGLLKFLVELATSNNGEKAATLAQESFIEGLNSSDLHLKVLTRDEMMANEAYSKVANKYIAMTQSTDDEGEVNQVLAAAEMLLGFMGNADQTSGNESVGSEGQPSYGLSVNWRNATTALTGGEDEQAYIKESIQALGVDAAIIINDPGISFTCDVCIGGTGQGSTGSAFLVSLVDKHGISILNMRQWFITSDGAAVMAAYAVNPLQHDDLFRGHGSKMAKVFVSYYKENSRI